jgi:hypothetical protein
MEYKWEQCPYFGDAVKYGAGELKELSRCIFHTWRRRVMNTAVEDGVTCGYVTKRYGIKCNNYFDF